MSCKDACKTLASAIRLTLAAALPAHAQNAGASPAPTAAAPVAAPDALPALPAADPALAATEHQEQVDNPYGLSALWAQGDVVARLVLIIMLIMSGATWYIMIMKLIERQKVYIQGKAIGGASCRGRVCKYV